MAQRIVNVENSNTCNGGDIKGEQKEQKEKCVEKLREKEEEKKKKREIHPRIINLP